MIDPASLGAQALTRAAASAAPSLGRLAFRKLRLLGTIDPTWVVGSDLKLSASDVVDLRAFLASERVRPLLSLYVASRVVSSSAGVSDLDVIREALRSESLRWSVDYPNSWSSDFDGVWDGLTSLFDSSGVTAPELQDFGDEIEQFSGFLRSPFEGTPIGFIHELLELAGDVDRLLKASKLADQVCSALFGQRLPMLINHSEVESQGEFLDLYVPRLLTDRSTGEQLSAAELAAAGRGMRAVLVGHPGAGKTTFVRHLTWSLARPDAELPAQPALIVRCRDYFNNGWNGSLLDYIANRLNVEFGILAERQTVASAVLLGRFMVIFDGLDEIMQVANRADFVQRVEAFAQAHPLVSILVTSRELGYSRTPFDAGLFDHFSLKEFDDAQVRDYAERWFASQNAEQLVESFMRDSLKVEDLRSNPLLLSLLCILYRARGAIPRRRREIYGRCADLLFHTWDAHRQIDQPEELPAYGARLMQEIARWVYKSPTAQGGLEEQVIEGVIAQYLEGWGVTGGEARLRARDFLEFCAGRAWLLASSGTSSHGQRIFSFTHRTFYEYFTAEALSRSAQSLDQLVDEVMAAYAADQTSVLPELIIQAYDERVNDGAKDAFKAFCEQRADAGLLLRLMNGSLLSAYARRIGFNEIMRQWEAHPDRFDEGGFDALFTLEPNAFQHFVEEYVEQDLSAKKLVAQGWAMSIFSGQGSTYTGEIAAMATGLADELRDEIDVSQDHLLENWLVLIGYREPRDDIDPYTVVRIGERVLPGALWLGLTSQLMGAEYAGAERLRSHWLSALSKRRRGLVSWPFATALGEALVQRASRETAMFGQLAARDLLTEEKKPLLAWVVSMTLMLAENQVRPAWLDFQSLGPEEIWPSAADFFSVREWVTTRRNEPDETAPRKVKHLDARLPSWSGRWLDGKLSMVGEPGNWSATVWGDVERFNFRGRR